MVTLAVSWRRASVSWSAEGSKNEADPKRGADGVLITPKS